MINRISIKTSLIAALMLFFGGQSIAQTSAERIALESPLDYSEFDVFGDTLDKYSVYFTGENHTYATFNVEFQLKLLKYLHANQNVRHFMFEQSPGLSYIINKIIIDKKTTHKHYLKDVFFGPFYDLVGELQEFNDTLSYDDKIKVHGIDIERFPAFSLYALNEIVDDLDKRGPGGEVFEQIKGLASSDFKRAGPSAFYNSNDENTTFQFGQVSAWGTLESIIDGSKKHRDTLSSVLGADSAVYFSILESIEVGHQWYLTELQGDIKSPIIRERYMAREFERIYKLDKEYKYYGQFGRCHLHKDQDAGRCYDYYMNSIANRINEINDELENQVLVIPIFYSNSKDFDKDVIESLGLDPEYMTADESYIIDLAYKNGDHSIVGFYSNLPFVVISNVSSDENNPYEYDWNIFTEEIHISGFVGNTYFRKFDKLNSALEAQGRGTFDNQFRSYAFSIDYFALYDRGSSFSFIYYPEISNGDDIILKGYNVTFGSSLPIGGRWFMGAFGLDFGYGKMKMVETSPIGPANIIQENGLNKTVYWNDMFTIDPNFQARITLPIISLNAKVGWAFDVSGKYWRLDGKQKDFAKTSFTAPYLMVGASLNFKN